MTVITHEQIPQYVRVFERNDEWAAKSEMANVYNDEFAKNDIHSLAI